MPDASDLMGADAPGLPEQPLGSGGKYLVGCWRPHVMPSRSQSRRGSAIRRKIKHVFLIIRENRTYDQILGDVAGGNGDASLAVFGDNATYAAYPVYAQRARAGAALPALGQLLRSKPPVGRRSQLDRSGHGALHRRHPVAGLAPRLPLQRRRCDCLSEEGPPVGCGGQQAGVRFKNYGEYIEYNTFNVPGCTPTNIYASKQL